MSLFQPDNLIQLSILLFFGAAAASILLRKRDALCNRISNIICIGAALILAWASLVIISGGHGPVDINLFKSTLPFIELNMRVDALSAVFLLILAILTICVSIYSIGYISHYYGKRNVGLFYLLYITFILSMVFVFTSSNAIFFYIAWEAMAVLSYFLVIFESEHEENIRAGTLYVVMTHIATAFLLIGFMICFSYTKSFDIFADSGAIPAGARNLVFILFLLGFGTKAGMIPLHIWLPYAHPAAPGNISALMSGIMIKTAIYGLIRFVPGYLGVEYSWWGSLILCIGIISAVLGIAYSFMENDIKRLLAYSSVENIGVIFIGLGVSFIALANGNTTVGALALIAAILHTMNHALFKGGLFLVAGSVHYSTGTKNIEKLGGLIKTMPLTALFALCFSIAIASIIPFNGFIGEWLTLQSIFLYIAPGQPGVNVLLILSVAGLGLVGALAAACFVKFFGISFLGRQRSESALKAKEVPATMNTGIGILAALCLSIGLFPAVVISLIDNAVSELLGVSIMGRMSGKFIISSYSMEISSNSISTLEVLLGLCVIVLLTLAGLRFFGGKYMERKYGTWDCGFEEINSRMQYTSTGFSKPIKIIFRILFRPSRKTTINGGTAYFPDTIEYMMTSESIFERYIYEPIFSQARILSRRAKFVVQTGNIQNYLVYIFVTVLVLMAYNKIV